MGEASEGGGGGKRKQQDQGARTGLKAKKGNARWRAEPTARGQEPEGLGGRALRMDLR